MKAYARMFSCPRFERCNAAICPLDPEWERRTHSTGDAVCFYLLEAVKHGSETRFELCTTGNMRSEVLRPLPDICSRWSAIRITVDRARTTGSRMDRLPPRRAP